MIRSSNLETLDDIIVPPENSNGGGGGGCGCLILLGVLVVGFFSVLSIGVSVVMRVFEFIFG